MSVLGHDDLRPRDRRGDAPPPASGLADPKPPVMRRVTVRLLSAVCLAVIVFGTLGPLTHGRGPWLQAADAWRWIPPQRPSDLNDVVTNLLVYIPVGIAFRLLVRRRGRAGWRDLTLGFTLALALSFLTEVLQQFMPTRSSNLADVYVNAVGALAGCLLAPPTQNMIRRIHAAIFTLVRRHPWTVLATLSVIGAAVLMTVPWDLTYSRVEVQLGRPFDLADSTRLAVFGLVGFALTGALAKTVPGGSPVIRKVLTRIVLLAVLLEAAQVFIASHACGVLDILVAIAGGLAGMASALLLLRAGVLQAERVGGHRPGPPTLTPPWRAAVQAALVFTIVCVAAPGVWPTGSAMADSGGPDIRWVPFQAHFLEPFPIAAADLLESIGAYTFIALLCLLLTRGSGRLASLMLLMGMIAVVELCPALTASRVADLTPLLLAVVAWLLAGRIWNAIYPPRPPSASATRGEARPRSVTAPGPTRQHRKLTS